MGLGASKGKPKPAKKKGGKKKGGKKKKKKLSKVEKCIAKAKAIQKKCKPAQFKKKKATAMAKAAKSKAAGAKATKVKTKKEEKALKKYKDEKMPVPKVSPVGIFQYKNLLYLANKDGTRSLIRYPTKACARARPGVVPEQFPKRKTTTCSARSKVKWP